MFSNRQIRAAKTGYGVASVILCLMGIVLIAVPDFSLSLFCTIGGVVFILFGIVKIIGYFSRDLYRLAFQYDLACGILLIALGLIFILRTNTMIQVGGIIFGVYILADALLKIQISLDARRFGLRTWWLILTAALLTGVAGFLLLLRPFESMRVVMALMGCALLAEGILNLITMLTAVKIINRQPPDLSDNYF